MAAPLETIEQVRATAVDLALRFGPTLLHPDRSRVVIPNRKIVGEILHNFGKIRQVDVTVGVSYDTDLNAAISLIQNVLRSRACSFPVPSDGRHRGG